VNERGRKASIVALGKEIFGTIQDAGAC